jgi:cyclohexyl-isocyanide hydratase
MRIVLAMYRNMTLLDAVGPAQIWSIMPGAQLQFVAAERGPVETDSGLSVTATHDFSTAWSDPDILFVGGGGAAAGAAIADNALTAFLAERGKRARWVTSVCTGSLILGASGLLDGYRASCHWAWRDRLPEFGAIPSDERVCIDRNRATGGGVTSGIDFGLKLVGLIAGEQAGRTLELAVEYNPAPPFGTGHPNIADAVTLAAAKELLGTG